MLLLKYVVIILLTYIGSSLSALYRYANTIVTISLVSAYFTNLHRQSEYTSFIRF